MPVILSFASASISAERNGAFEAAVQLVVMLVLLCLFVKMRFRVKFVNLHPLRLINVNVHIISLVSAFVSVLMLKDVPVLIVVVLRVKLDNITLFVKRHRLSPLSSSSTLTPRESRPMQAFRH